MCHVLWIGSKVCNNGADQYFHNCEQNYLSVLRVMTEVNINFSIFLSHQIIRYHSQKLCQLKAWVQSSSYILSQPICSIRDVLEHI